MTVATLLVQGAGYPPLLAACLLARFAPCTSRIALSSTGSLSEDVIIRPAEFKALNAIGLQRAELLKAGAQAATKDGSAPTGQDNPRADELTISAHTYEALLASVASRADIHRDPSDPDVIFDTDTQNIEKTSQIPIGLGRHCLPSVRHVSIIQGTMDAVFALPRDWSDQTEIQELKRRAQRSTGNIRDMISLLSGTEASETLQHRIDVWLAMGRVCPFDDDPFSVHEWSSVMHATVGEPKAQSLFSARRRARA
ncbi:MAG: hypothetical protein AAF830_05625 [Pseudomonadota bacterium]